MSRLVSKNYTSLYARSLIKISCAVYNKKDVFIGRYKICTIQINSQKIEAQRAGENMHDNNEENSRNFENSGDVNGPVVNNSGNRNKTIINPSGMKAIELGEDEGYNNLTRLSKWLFDALGEKKYGQTFFGTMIASLIGVILSLLRIAVSLTGGISIANFSLIIYLIPMFILATIAGFAENMLRRPRKTTCPQCQQPFLMRHLNSTLLNERQVKDTIVRNYKELEQCVKCGYQNTYTAIEKESVSSSTF